MSKKKDGAPINADQSAKSRTGAANNISNTLDCKAWANGIDRIWVKDEMVTIREMPMYLGMITQVYHIKMDQVIVAACLEKREAIVVHIDGTTSFRGERVTTKANEGAVMELTKTEVNLAIIEAYPHLEGFRFTHICAVVLPNQISGMEDCDKEEEKALMFFVNVNHKISGKYVTDTNKNGMDFAGKMADLLMGLDNIIDNQHRYNIDKLVLAYVWIEQHSNDYKYMPTLDLNENSAFFRRDHLIWDLHNRPQHYYRVTKCPNPKDPLGEFLISKGITDFNPEKFAQKKALVIDYLCENYPPQTTKSMLEFVDAEFEKIRNQWAEEEKVKQAFHNIIKNMSEDEVEKNREYIEEMIRYFDKL